MLIKLASLLLFTSCALFSGNPSLETKDKEELLKSVKLTGEGRGRLTLGQSHYVFSVDSVLKENYDWILAVSIPLKGEEVMILPDLRQKSIPDEEAESFEQRIQQELSRLKLNISGEEFIAQLRSLVRFNLAPELGLKRECEAEESSLVCQFEGEKFIVEIGKQELKIKKPLSSAQNIVLSATNLTESFFSKTDIVLEESAPASSQKTPPLALELFW